MAETELTEALADGLSGTTDSGTDLIYPTIYESTYYTTMYRFLQRLLLLGSSPGGNELRVCMDGSLTVEVRAGRIQVGSNSYTYAGCTGEALADDETNYVYLAMADIAAGDAVTVNTTGFPTDDALFIPLAVVLTGSASVAAVSGKFDYRDITDHRGRGNWGLCGGVKITAEAEAEYAANERRVTIQGGPWRQKVRVWISDADYGAPDDTGNTVTVETGTAMGNNDVANEDYEIISDASGTVKIDITIAGAASRYVMAEIDGVIYSSGELTWAA